MYRYKWLAATVALVLSLALFTGCANTSTGTSSSGEDTDSPVASGSQEEIPPPDRTRVRVGTLKGPTGMGMVGIMAAAEAGTSENDYTFSIKGAPEDVRAMLINGEADIAALPTNMAAVLYNQDPDSIQMLVVNTLGVLYILESGGNEESPDVQSIESLRGKTLSITGQGSAPEYVLEYLLRQSGLDPETDLSIEYKSEHAELATLFVAGEVSLGMLPEPHVTTTLNKAENTYIALDITEEWEKVSGGAALAMGCIVVRKEFAEEHPQAVEAFLREYEESVMFVNRDIEDAAEIMERFDIITAQVAQKAIPNCNIVFLTGDDMVDSVKSFLTVLYEANDKAVGGSVPDDAFYYQS